MNTEVNHFFQRFFFSPRPRNFAFKFFLDLGFQRHQFFDDRIFGTQISVFDDYFVDQHGKQEAVRLGKFAGNRLNYFADQFCVGGDLKGKCVDLVESGVRFEGENRLLERHSNLELLQ